MAKVIFHIDLNSFFASAEVVKDPTLAGLPLAVGGLSKRSVVCTASYEARAYGVKSAMPLFQAMKLCPSLIVLKGDMAWYETLSKKFFAFIRTYSPYIEIASIDECYVDVSELIKQYSRPLDLAWEIQKKLFDEIGLSCSIGVASNKFLAKMASDMKKPMGITVLRKSELSYKLWPLSIDEMFGIGKKGAPNLKFHGIETIYDIANPDNEVLLIKLLGKHGLSIIHNARGQGSDTLVFNRSVQSISQSTTMQNDVSDYNEIQAIFERLSKSLANRAMDEKVSGKLISISIRYYDFKNCIRSMNAPTLIEDAHTIYEFAMTIFDQHYSGVPVRHLGISLGSLQSNNKQIVQMNIFQEEHPKINVLNELNKLLDKPYLTYASSLLEEKK